MNWEAIAPIIGQLILVALGALLGGIVSWRITKHFDDKNRREKRFEDERRRLFEFRHILSQAYKDPSDNWQVEFQRSSEGTRLSLTNTSGETITGLHVEPSTYIDGIGVSSEVDMDVLWEWSDATRILQEGPEGVSFQDPSVSNKGIPEYSLQDGETLYLELDGLIDEVDCARIVYDSPSDLLPTHPSELPMADGRSWPFKREIPIGISPVDSMKDFRPGEYTPSE